MKKVVRNSLYWKLALAFMAVAVLTAGLLAVFIRVTSTDRLYQLILDQQRTTMVEALTQYYSIAGSWDGIEDDWFTLQRIVAANSGGPKDDPPAQMQGQQPPDHRQLFGLADSQGRVLVAVDNQYPVGSQLPASILRRGTAIEVDGQVIGTVITAGRISNYNPAEARFLQRTNLGLIGATVLALAAALLLGVTLANRLTRPLQALTEAARAMTQGETNQRVKVQGNDEIGQLAGAFNQMSAEVTRANQQRRQMTADIAHDLRTPLTVIAGYVESMRDGVLQPTEKRFGVIYSEIERLQSLVEDLRMLSQADAGELRLNPQAIAPAALLEHAAELFQHHAERQGVRVAVEVQPGLPDIRADEARMMQVLDNLMSNALRYTPEGGKITLSARAANGRGVEIVVEDTGTGIEANQLALIFDRFHRADTSRHTDTGESGLGLAIVKALVEAHGGSVWAESQPGQGTKIRIVFPA